MVNKFTVIIGVGLLVAFLVAGGGSLTKEAIDKTRTELALVKTGISARTKKTKEKMA